jgi:hypothetical protein
VEGLIIQVIIMAIFGSICAVIASSRGRSAVAWFFIGSFFSCLGLILLLVIPDLKVQEEERQRMALENRRLREQIRKDRMIADQRRDESERRLTAHDRVLNLDTSTAQQEVSPPPIHRELTGSDSEQFAVPWYYVDGGNPVGPISLDDLKNMWKEARLQADSLVWHEGMREWIAVSAIRGLKEVLNA